jgi:hypothetical protein
LWPLIGLNGSPGMCSVFSTCFAGGDVLACFSGTDCRATLRLISEGNMAAFSLYLGKVGMDSALTEGSRLHMSIRARSCSLGEMLVEYKARFGC